jgi:hypothetical protein
VEIKQYVVGQDSNLKTLVPRVVGHTEKPRIPYEAESFHKELETKRGAEEAAIAGKIREWYRNELPRHEWNRSSQYGIIWPYLGHKGKAY